MAQKSTGKTPKGKNTTNDTPAQPQGKQGSVYQRVERPHRPNIGALNGHRQHIPLSCGNTSGQKWGSLAGRSFHRPSLEKPTITAATRDRRSSASPTRIGGRDPWPWSSAT